MTAVLRHELLAAPTFRTHLGLGIAYGYPVCCALRFSFQARGSRGQALERGVASVDGSKERVFVPCGIFHRAR